MTEDAQAEKPKKTIITVPPGGLEFRGEDGTLLASIEPLTGGGAAFTVGGENGMARAFLWSGAGDAGVSFRTGTGSVRVSAGPTGGNLLMDGPVGAGVSMGADVRGGMLTLHGRGMNTAVRLDTGEDGRGQGYFADAQGSVQIGFLTGPEGGLVRTLTASGKPAVDACALGEDGGLIVWDKSGAKSFAVPAWKFTTGGQKPDEGKKPETDKPGG